MPTDPAPKPAVTEEEPLIKWPIPEIGDPVPQTTLNLEHPKFTRWKKYWEFFRHSDELTGGYAASVETYTGPAAVPEFDETYLIPHTKELSPADFRRRVAASRPPRFVREGIESIVGVLTTQQPNRDNYPEALSEWTTSVTPKGATLQQWLSTDFWPLVERYGHCYTLARRPTIDGANLAEQEKKISDAGLPPVILCIITPEMMPWWETNELGQFLIVHYIEEKNEPKQTGSFATENVKFKRHWWITAEGWWYADEGKDNNKTGVVVNAAGTWNADSTPMNHFPVAKWGLKDDIGPTHAASFAQLAYFRKESELHLVEENSAFAMTWIPTTAGDENPEEMVRGSHIIGGWDPETSAGAKPMILEPSGVSLAHFQDKRLPDLEAAALAPYGRQREVGGNDSGVALAHIQQTAVNIYRQHSKAGGQSEFAGLQPVAELLDTELTEDMRAAWPSKFGTLSDTSQGELLKMFWELEPGEEFQQHILTLFSSIVGELTADQLTEALDSWRAEKEEQKQKEEEEKQALFGEVEGEDGGGVRREQGVKKPFAANPASAKGPDKGQKP